MAVNMIRDVVAGAAVLGILVLLHEWGHFVVAKLCGVRVDVFSVGFGPRLWGVKRGDTDYRVSALPLGGYVRMAGDNPVEERSGAPYEFLSRPRWQRFLIAVAGPFTNILATFVIFWAIYAFVGMPTDAYLRQPADVAAVPLSSANVSPIRPGDRILEVNGVQTATWGKATSQIEKAKAGSSLSLVVLRSGSRQALTVRVPQSRTAIDTLAGYPLLPPVIEDVQPGSPASKSGMKPGDTIVSINGQPVVTWLQLVDRVRGSEGHSVQFLVRRDGKDVQLDITPMQSMTPDGETAWLIGASRKADEVFEHQGLVASVKDAAAETYLYASLIGDVVAGLFRGQLSVRDLAGPVGIVQLSGQAAKGGAITLLNWMAYISLDLGLLNLLPIPILDGGHVLMLAIEGTLRRDLSITFKERFVQVGLVFLLGLFAFVMYSDILRLVHQ
ncbi:MAG TPA: RIP metalloprotease RseP [Candidatus Polarisedimenticolia bacterium]|nr:RIP metalloprotease RseP [Candidatus Polarisedimenticolia bacterium]